VAWNGDLPRHLQQVLFDAADTAALPAASDPGSAADPVHSDPDRPPSPDPPRKSGSEYDKPGKWNARRV
jgi:hypothetical protein